MASCLDFSTSSSSVRTPWWLPFCGDVGDASSADSWSGLGDAFEDDDAGAKPSSSLLGMRPQHVGGHQARPPPWQLYLRLCTDNYITSSRVLEIR